MKTKVNKLIFQHQALPKKGRRKAAQTDEMTSTVLRRMKQQ